LIAPTHTPILFRIALTTALLGIGYLATTPMTYPVVSSINDKVEHLVAFLLLAFLGDFAFPRYAWSWRKYLPLMGYGLLLETIQYFLPFRSFSLADLLADAIGLALYPVLRRVWAMTCALRAG
jgi:VanZ family protein